MLISIGILLYFILVGVEDEDLAVGNAQSMLLVAYEEAEHTANYLDMALITSKKNVKPEIIQRTGFFTQTIRDSRPEYPCGNLAHPIINSQECFPDFMETYEKILEREMNSHAAELNINQDISVESSTNRGETILRVFTLEPIKNQIYYNRELYELEKRTTAQIAGLSYNILPGLSNRPRNNEITIDRIVLHYTMTSDLQTAYDNLQNSRLSYHYIIDLEGEVYQALPESRVALHASCGDSPRVNCQQGFNDRSISVALVNCGFDNRNCRVYECAQIKDGKCFAEYPEEQIASATRLITQIAQRHRIGIDQNSIIGYSDIDQNQYDPGPAFPIQDVIRDVQEGVLS